MQNDVNWDEIGMNLMREGFTFRQAEEGLSLVKERVAAGVTLDVALGVARLQRDLALNPPEPEPVSARDAWGESCETPPVEAPHAAIPEDVPESCGTGLPAEEAREREQAFAPLLTWQDVRPDRQLNADLEGMLRYRPQTSAEEIARLFTQVAYRPGMPELGQCPCGAPGCRFPSRPAQRESVMSLDIWSADLVVERGPDIAYALRVNYMFTGDQANRAVGRAEDFIRAQEFSALSRGRILDQLIEERHSGLLDRDHECIALTAKRCGYEADPHTWPMNATNQIQNAIRSQQGDARGLRTSQIIAYIGGERNLEHYRCPEPLLFRERQVITLEMCLDFPRLLRDELVFHHGFTGYQAWQALRDLREILARNEGQGASGTDCLLLVTARRDSAFYERDRNNPGATWYGFIQQPPVNPVTPAGRDLLRHRKDYSVPLRTFPPDNHSPSYVEVVEIGNGEVLDVKGRGETVRRGYWSTWPATVDGKAVLLLRGSAQEGMPNEFVKVISPEEALDLAAVLLSGVRTMQRKD